MEWFSLETPEEFFASILRLARAISSFWASFEIRDYYHYPWGKLEWKEQYLPVVAVVIVFWPIVLSLVLAASTWIFWLFTSIVFGIFQFIYATYQFFMIFGDIVCLSTLKSYSVLRNIILYNIFGTKKSRRRIWRKRVREASSYEQFLKVPVSEPAPSEIKKHETKSTDGSSYSMRRPSSWVHSSDSRLIKRSATALRLSDRTHDSSHPIKRSTSLLHINPFPDNEQTTTWLNEELGKMGDILVNTTNRLRQSRQDANNPAYFEDAVSSMKYLLSGVMKRNHLTLDDILINNARTVAEAGKYSLSEQAREAIDEYYDQVQASLDWFADSPVTTGVPRLNNTPLDGFFRVESDNSIAQRRAEFKDRITLVRKMKQNMGRTALMLSGGGAQAMYHLGTIRALIDSDQYDSIKVISGTSGGSITAAMCAIKTTEELFRDVCVSTVSTDFMLTGEMRRNNIRWFPTVMEMGACWFKKSLLVESSDFKKCCDFYFGDTTFEEAFERTGKHVCITVSASRATGGTAQRLLLNHISTPHVTLSSAVAASCALPGVMAPAKLLIKDSNGNQEPFEVDGVDWIDGSVQADLPFQRISTLFNVSNYVVCQTNFHVVPFLNKEHHPNQRSFYWRLFQTLEWDMRNRALKLSRLGLFPRIFGQDISKVFKQKYHGNLTLVPKFTAMQTLGLKALANPTVKDMEGYLKFGQMAAWPYLR